eukprot:752837-Hanusia_phi.AAC.4
MCFRVSLSGSRGGLRLSGYDNNGKKRLAKVSGDPLFTERIQVRSRHFRRLKASFAYSAIQVAGTVRRPGSGHGWCAGYGRMSDSPIVSELLIQHPEGSPKLSYAAGPTGSLRVRVRRGGPVSRTHHPGDKSVGRGDDAAARCQSSWHSAASAGRAWRFKVPGSSPEP